MQPATANLASGAQVPIVLTVAAATNGETPFGRKPGPRRFDPSLPAEAARRLRGIVFWLFLLLLLIVAWRRLQSAGQCIGCDSRKQARWQFCSLSGWGGVL